MVEGGQCEIEIKAELSPDGAGAQVAPGKIKETKEIKEIKEIDYFYIHYFVFPPIGSYTPSLPHTFFV